MCSIGKCYESGIGIEPDEKKAIESYERATEMGDSEAMCILGEYYLNGVGVEEDKKKAVELFKRASELGNQRAKSNLDFNRELAEKYAVQGFPTVLLLNARGTADGPYPFFRVRRQSARATVLWILALLALCALLSAGVCLAAG